MSIREKNEEFDAIKHKSYNTVKLLVEKLRVQIDDLKSLGIASVDFHELKDGTCYIGLPFKMSIWKMFTKPFQFEVHIKSHESGEVMVETVKCKGGYVYPIYSVLVTTDDEVENEIINACKLIKRQPNSY